VALGVDETSSSAEPDAGVKPVRDVRRQAWGERLALVMAGWRRGTSGVAIAIAGVGVLAVTTVNVLSELHDGRRIGVPVPPVPAFAYEYTSGAGILLAFCLVAPLARLRPGQLGWPRFLAVHLAGATAYSAVHILAMVGLRHLVWALVGRSYDFDFGADWLYEYRKDLISYVLLSLIVVFAPRRPPRTAALPEEVRLPDGRRAARFPAELIEAAEACGNYVELKLADGARPLVRATLAAAEAELAPYGFVRTHRSWLVRADRVTALAPTGAGDHLVTLASGLSAPLSRRFPASLATLRERLDR
jgi:hypothetical protein